MALSVTAVRLINVGQQSALVTEGLMAVNTLQGGAEDAVLRWGALWVALGDVPLEFLWDIEALLAAAAFTCLFQFPFVCPRVAVLAPLMYLHVAVQGAGRQEASAAHGALVGFVGGVGFHVDLEVVTSGEGRVTLPTVVLLVAGVQLDVAVPAALVLEQAATEGAAEGELVTVTLLVALEEAQATEGLVTKLAWVRQAGASFVFAKIIVLAVSGRSLVLTGGGRCRPRAQRVILNICSVCRGNKIG